ncbi:Ras-like GTP-binding protein RYL2 [Aphelenchoides besseyi]|nr:Ras-like GTP-binding protein RYL2 [Aphelenchoides besseyi]
MAIKMHGMLKTKPNEFKGKVVMIEVELSIWDTAGQERFKSMLPMYTRKAVAAIFVYDITRYDSFRNLEMWFNGKSFFI